MFLNLHQLAILTKVSICFETWNKMGQSFKAFLLTSIFCRKGIVCLWPGTIYMFNLSHYKRWSWVDIDLCYFICSKPVPVITVKLYKLSYPYFIL